MWEDAEEPLSPALNGQPAVGLAEEAPVKRLQGPQGVSASFLRAFRRRVDPAWTTKDVCEVSPRPLSTQTARRAEGQKGRRSKRVEG